MQHDSKMSRAAIIMKASINIKIGKETIRLSIPFEEERSYRVIGQELDRCYYAYKSKYPDMSDTKLLTLIVYAYVVHQELGKSLHVDKDLTYSQLRRKAWLASVKNWFGKYLHKNK